MLRVFEARESEEYKAALSEVFSLEPSQTSPGLLQSSYQPGPEILRKIVGEKYSDKIKGIINIDYIGMAATVLLDRRHKYTKHSQYARLRQLMEDLSRINNQGVALRMRILLQYPYSLAGQNRILADTWRERSYMGERNESMRDETCFAPPLREGDIQHSMLLQTQRYCLQNLQDLSHQFPWLRQEPNRIAVRFACISTLLCGLRANNLLFYDPYHYGKRQDEEACAITSTPVVQLDGRVSQEGYETFCNHFQYIWECDSTLDYEDVAYQEPGKRTVFIRRPDKVLTTHKIERLKHLPVDNVDWDRRSSQLRHLVNAICPLVAPVDQPEVGFLAAAWEPKPDGSHNICEPAAMLEDFFKRDLGKVDHVRVAVLRGELGQSLSGALFDLMNASTFSIIVLTKAIEGKYCRPNVYIELGYLLHKNKAAKTFVIAENGVELSADIQDVIYLPFQREGPQFQFEMKRVYKKLLLAMCKAGIMSRSTVELFI